MRLPGFIDSHLHVLGIGYYQSILDLSSAKSVRDVIDILNNHKNQSMIIGRGWNQDQFKEERMLHKDDLNEVSSEIPIILTRVCGHVLVVNDKMLEIANIHQDTPQVFGGSFDYQTGVFSENALSLIHKNMPKLDRDTLRNYFLKANESLLQNGITSVASDDFCVFENDYEEIIDVLKELYDEGLMKVKITEQVNLPMHKLKDFLSKGYANKSIHPSFKMGPLKILADGSLGGRTAAMLEPYNDDPNQTGILSFTDEELFDLIHLADQHKMDSVIHAIGDKTSLQAINAIEKSISITKRYQHAHAIIHAQLTPRDQVERMKKFNIGAIVQPIFINTDILIVEKRIGQRKDNVYLFHTMYKNIPFGFSTDAPIEPINPFYNIFSAMTYKSMKYPLLPSFNKNECFTLEEAMKSYTINNLPFIYEKTLNEADYIIVDKDIYTLESEEIKDVKVLKTFVNGEEVFSLKTDK